MSRVDIRAPQEQEGTKTVVKTWLVKVGERVKKNAPVVELETDKVAVEVAADADGTLAEIILHEGADAAPGALLGRLDTAVAASAPPPNGDARRNRPIEPVTGGSPPPKGDERGLSAAVRRRLNDARLDPASIKGTGAGGRVTLDDVEKALAKLAERPAPVSESRPGVKRVPHDSMRLRIAEHMTRQLSHVPHVTAVFECDCSAIVAHRAAHKDEFRAKGAALTYTAYFVRAAAEAMTVAPAVNGRWTENALELFDDVNIGVGTATPDGGLVVPVIRRVQDKSLFDIARILTDLTERARTNRLVPADVQGGTFSMSNHGVSGTLFAAPIVIVEGQSASLGIGKMENRAVVRDDKVAAHPMCYVTLTIDHRALDGQQCNAWLTRFVGIVENWAG